MKELVILWGDSYWSLSRNVWYSNFERKKYSFFICKCLKFLFIEGLGLYSDSDSSKSKETSPDCQYVGPASVFSLRSLLLQKRNFRIFKIQHFKGGIKGVTFFLFFFLWTFYLSSDVLSPDPPCLIYQSRCIMRTQSDESFCSRRMWAASGWQSLATATMQSKWKPRPSMT